MNREPLSKLAHIVGEAAREALEEERELWDPYAPGRVWWYLPERVWCRVWEPEAVPIAYQDMIPIEYPDRDEFGGMIPMWARRDELVAWPPDGEYRPWGGDY